MFASMMLLAAGQVIAVDGSTAVVRTSTALEVGETLTIQRLEHAPGAPGRAPFFRWKATSQARVTAVRPDGTADVAIVRGRMTTGDRVAE